jgi:hypothetical protein
MTVTARARGRSQQARPSSLISFTASASAIYDRHGARDDYMVPRRRPDLRAWRDRRGMPGVTRALFLAALVLLAMRLALADFVNGCAAFDRGDFQAARKEWEPLAKEGHAPSQFRLGCL